MAELQLLLCWVEEFASPAFWEYFFREQGKWVLEWYGGWRELRAPLGWYLHPRDSILVVGCGNSELSEQLYDEGYEDIINVVLGKGTLDALLTDAEESNLSRTERMFSEFGRVLQFGGRYLCVSLTQGHVLKTAVEHFYQKGWMVQIHQVSSNEAGTSEGKFALPICLCYDKMPVTGSSLCILELCAETQDKPVQFKNTQHLIEAVKERQQYSLLQSQLSRNPTAGTISLDLCNEETSQVRSSLHVVHNPTCCIDVVEIDPSILEVTTHWFDFFPGDRLKVHIADGLDYIANLATKASSYDAVIFDVDSKDSTLGMSCPPAAFVEKSFLQKVGKTQKRAMKGVGANLLCEAVATSGALRGKD
ncbi:hypothetical protein JD844_012298, partial [Phrynosoma platyrhinos]